MEDILKKMEEAGKHEHASCVRALVEQQAMFPDDLELAVEQVFNAENV
jgi:hypothetical protein